MFYYTCCNIVHFFLHLPVDNLQGSQVGNNTILQPIWHILGLFLM